MKIGVPYIIIPAHNSSFDIFLPAEYPVVPPKMTFVLNGNDGDTYSFNPNLHVGGTGEL